MKALVHNVIPHYIEYDIIDSGGIKKKQYRIHREYFDLSEQLIITNHHRPYAALFSKIQTFYLKFRTLRSNNISLYLEEKKLYCHIWLIQYDAKKQQRKKLFCQQFPREEWANIEELFLKAGLTVKARYTKQVIEFKLKQLSSYYTLIMENEINTMIVESNTKDELIKALTLVGYSIDQVEINND